MPQIIIPPAERRIEINRRPEAQLDRFIRGQLIRILGTLAKVRLGADSSYRSLQFLPLGMFSSQALIVIISPLIPGDRSIFHRLQARGNEVLLLCPGPIRFASNGRSRSHAVYSVRLLWP